MSRLERLFRVLQSVQAHECMTAAELGRQLGVARRTVYRDIADLQASGVPVEGHPGRGFRWSGRRLAPLMFTPLEAQALATAVGIGRHWCPPGQVPEATAALERVLAAMPADLAGRTRSVQVVQPPGCPEPGEEGALAAWQQAIRERRKVRLQYRDLAEIRSQRTVHPQGCEREGALWALAAWCERRRAPLRFRLDRVESLQVLDAHY
ncbi:MAG TPA: YafY family protein [Ramlibacter sp.]|nr:YafY family protein [Ramlibacter sp.]